MNTILFVGPPGSGKGTQAERFAREYDLVHFSTGKHLRSIKDKYPEVKKVMDNGGIVDDDFVLKTIFDYFEDMHIVDNLILDGTPRTLYQYKKLKKWFFQKGHPICMAIFINISEEEAVRRLGSRREDPKTGKTYNLLTNPPPEDVDEDELSIRADDEPEAIVERFQQYHKLTEPLINELKNDEILVEIDGERPIEEIHDEIKAYFEKQSPCRDSK